MFWEEGGIKDAESAEPEGGGDGEGVTGFIKTEVSGTSLVVQWLRLHFQCRECGIHPWLGELRSHNPCGVIYSLPKKRGLC